MRLTDPLPLRTSPDLGPYTEIYTLPRVLGSVVLEPVRFDGSGHLWLISDGVIAGVDRVEYQQRQISTWTLHRDVDSGGRAVSVLETQQQVADPSELRLWVRGEQHPRTGQALDRPDLQAWFILSEIAGLDIEEAEFDDLRAVCQTAGLRTGGVIDDYTLSVQGWLDRVLFYGAGVAWGWDMPGLAAQYPQLPSDSVATVKERHWPDLMAVADAEALCTRLVLEYDYDWALSDHRATLTLTAPASIERFGEITRRIQASWIHDARSALAYGRRYLEYFSRVVWSVQGGGPDQPAPGSTVAIEHAYSPVDSALVRELVRGDVDDEWAADAPVGAVPEISLEHTAGAVDIDLLQSAAYTYQDRQAVWLITDDKTQQPLKSAAVTLDNGVTRYTDSLGYVAFDDVDPGRHTLFIRASGKVDRTIEVVVA